VTERERQMKLRTIAKAAIEAGGHVALTRRLDEATGIGNEAMMESWDGRFEMPGDVPSTVPTTLHDGRGDLAPALVIEGRRVPVAGRRDDKALAILRYDMTGTGVPLGDDMMRAVSARVGRDAWSAFGERAETSVRLCVVRMRPNSLQAEAIVALSRDVRQRWRNSSGHHWTSLTPMEIDFRIHEGDVYWTHGEVSWPYQRSIAELRKTGSMEEESRVEKRIRRGAVLLGAMAIGSPFMGGIMGLDTAAIIIAAVTPAVTAILLLILAAIAPADDTDHALAMIERNKEGVALLYVGAMLASPFMPAYAFLLPQALMTLALWIRIERTRPSVDGHVTTADGPKRDARVPRVRPGLRQAVDALVSACGVLDEDRMRLAETAARACLRIEGFDAEDPLVEDARRSVDALPNVLTAHRDAMRYATEEDGIVLAERIVTALTSAADAVEDARRALLASASSKLETQTRYIAARSGHGLESIR
jgi:hypothetical protein